jgi:hypothetical protein
MRVPGLTPALLALGVGAFVVASGCDQLGPWWEAVHKSNGTGTSGTGAGGTSGSASMCVRITEGGPGTCEDYSTYKIRSADLCAQKNLVISSLEPGAMCGNGGVESMTFLCCPPAPAPTPVTCSEGTDRTGRVCKTCTDANGKIVSTDCNSGGASGQMCTTNRLSTGTGCKSYDLWKQDASATCTKQNLLLTSIAPGPDCDGGIVGVTFTCCGGPPPPPTCGQSIDATGQTCKTCWDSNGKAISNDCSPPTGGGGSSGGQMCTKTEMGGSTSCKPYDLWKQYASDVCMQQNLLLTGLAPGATCGDGVYQSISFTCCAPTPSPPAPKCTQTTDASGQVCKTCVDSVTGTVVSNDCAPGPGSGSGMCIAIDDGGPSSCKDDATWKMYGTDRCAQQNLALTGVKVAVPCAGGASQVTYVCCAP